MTRRTHDHRPASGAPSYEESKRLARDADPEVRRRLAARPDLRPEVLYYLAEDPDPAVRREVARNPQAPRHADFLLAKDGDPHVRTDLAEKIARLLPELPAEQRARVQRLALRTLDLLARDQVLRVRQILAEALKDVPHAPHETVLRLAQDRALEVALPLLEFSPVLTDDDLLEIVGGTTESAALAAISRRSELRPAVADAVAETGDEAAIADLLANRGAQIREETLDRLIEAAPARQAWHGPLVRRPRLAARAAAHIAQFVARSLLAELERRTDLGAEALSAVAQVVARRLHETEGEAEAGGDVRSPRVPDRFDPDWGGGDGSDDEAEVAALAAAGRLDEEAVSEAMAAGKRRFVKAALARLAGVSAETVQKAVALRSSKGVVALCWKGGLGMRLALQLQLQLCGLPPASLIRPTLDQGYPMTPKDMEWQLQFLAETTA